MDVWKIIPLAVMAALAAACTKEATPTTGQFYVDSADAPGSAESCPPQSVIPNSYLVKWKNGRVTVESASSPRELVERFHSRASEIDFAEPNYRLHTFQSATPPISSAPDPNWGSTMVKAPAAWTNNVKGAGVLVAVVDTGVQISLAQLAGQVYTNPGEIPNNGIDDDKNGFIDDVHGWDFVHGAPLTQDNNIHGTHVAGIIAADPSKGPVQGMAPQATLLPLAFMDENGEGSTADAVSAINYATAAGAKVINASWGGSGCSLGLQNAIAQFNAKGGLFMAAAGNDGEDIDNNPSYPASYVANNLSNLITVAASTWLDDEAGFSNDGANTVFLAAPGLDITSTVPVSSTYPDGLASLSGTSMATPFVTGAAALLWSDRPKATNTQVMNAILQSVDAGPFLVSTHGRLDVQAALQKLEAAVSQ